MLKAAIAEPPVLQQLGLLKRVQEILGVQPLRSDQDLVLLVDDRLSTGAIAGLRRSGLTDDEIYSLIVPRRTLTHLRARHESLSGEHAVDLGCSRRDDHLPRAMPTSAP